MITYMADFLHARARARGHGLHGRRAPSSRHYDDVLQSHLRHATRRDYEIRQECAAIRSELSKSPPLFPR